MAEAETPRETPRETKGKDKATPRAAADAAKASTSTSGADKPAAAAEAPGARERTARSDGAGRAPQLRCGRGWFICGRPCGWRSGVIPASAAHAPIIQSLCHRHHVSYNFVCSLSQRKQNRVLKKKNFF